MKLLIDAGTQTEEIVKFILNGLEPEEIKAVDVDRLVDQPEGLASEPIVIAAVVTLGPIVAAGVVRLIERWLEAQRQETQLRLVIEAYAQSDEAGKAVANLAETFNTVSVTYGPVSLPEPNVAR